MCTLTIRNLDQEVKNRLRLEAARHGHSMEEEARIILRTAVSHSDQEGLGTRIRARFANIGGEDLELPGRKDKPRAPDF
jgi:plasmid stability protein